MDIAHSAMANRDLTTAVIDERLMLGVRRYTFDDGSQITVSETHFEDGTSIAYFKLALAALYSADLFEPAKELADRYDLYGHICLCCAAASVSVSSAALRLTGYTQDPWWYQLCVACNLVRAYEQSGR